MRKCAIFALPLLVSLAFSCSKTPSQERKATAPLLIPSKQVQRRFFACKALVGKEWVGIGENFSTDDEKIIIVTRLDPTELESRLMVEIISPESRIIEKEAREYDAVRDIGIYFDPVVLVDKGGAGKYEARIYSDARPVGDVAFFVEDRREGDLASQQARNPALSEIEWESPAE